MARTVILVTKTWLGHVSEADRVFGEAMLDKFLHTLEAAAVKPAAICFYTEGVKLVARGSPVELGLRILAGMGVRMVICQSCLQQYSLADQVVVGTVGGMVDIVAEMMSADNVVTI
jgi:hypothetical protein